MYSSKLFFAVVDFDEGQDVFATVRMHFNLIHAVYGLSNLMLFHTRIFNLSYSRLVFND